MHNFGTLRQPLLGFQIGRRGTRRRLITKKSVLTKLLCLSHILHSDQNQTNLTAQLSCSAGLIHFAHTTIVAYLILRRSQIVGCRFVPFFFVESTTFETKKVQILQNLPKFQVFVRKVVDCLIKKPPQVVESTTFHRPMKIPPFVRPNIAQCGGQGGPRFCLIGIIIFV